MRHNSEKISDINKPQNILFKHINNVSPLILCAISLKTTYGQICDEKKLCLRGNEPLQSCRGIWWIQCTCMTTFT